MSANGRRNVDAVQKGLIKLKASASAAGQQLGYGGNTTLPPRLPTATLSPALQLAYGPPSKECPPLYTGNSEVGMGMYGKRDKIGRRGERG